MCDMYVRYVGGSVNHNAIAIAVDSAATRMVAGVTTSPDLPAAIWHQRLRAAQNDPSWPSSTPTVNWGVLRSFGRSFVDG